MSNANADLFFCFFSLVEIKLSRTPESWVLVPHAGNVSHEDLRFWTKVMCLYLVKAAIRHFPVQISVCFNRMLKFPWEQQGSQCSEALWVAQQKTTGSSFYLMGLQRCHHQEALSHDGSAQNKHLTRLF